jgi:LuxR family maltose regulon positive regulatory protein
MDALMLTQNQLLATKFHVPVTLGRLISRPRLTALLNESLNRPFTLVSAPAGFGKTTLLSTWSQSLLPNHPRVAWVSLEEEDNDPRQFWTYVLTALKMQQPNRFTEVLMQLQSPQPLPIKYILAALINLLADGTDDFLLILDDYQMITEQEIHTILAYLIEHLPPQLHIILATRADPPLPLPLLRASQQALEVRTDQLRCTVEETRTFFEKVIGIQLPAETIQEVATRTEGWLVGLQLLGLSLPEHASSLTLLEQASGDQRYILDYLTQEVLQRQSQEVQAFLLSTSILERLSASLCDAIMEQSGSQQMLEQLEQANLFVTALDSKCQWYRYHALFAEALSYRLEQRHADRLSSLHHRASLWYAEHDQTTQAIVHAFKAQQWNWAADLLERESLHLTSLTWGAGQRALVMLKKWIEQLPEEVMHARPALCLACTQLLWTVAHHTKLDGWLDAAEASLSALLLTQTHEDASVPTLAPQVWQERANRLGEVITFRAVVRSHEEDAQVALPLCQQALALLSPDNLAARAFVAWAQLRALYASPTNNAVAAIESGLQSGSLAQAAGKTALTIGAIGATVMYMIGAGRLHEVQQLTQQARQLGTQPGGLVSPDVCWPAIWQAEVLREWNKLDAALELVEEAISLSSQTTTIVSIGYSLFGYVVLMRIALSRGELGRASSALQEFEHIKMHMNQPLALHYHSLFTTVDQVRLWFACGERDRALRWAEELDLGAQHRAPFAREREEVAYARVRLATQQPVLALERLELVLQRARAGQRWGHVIEIRLLQARAHQMCHEISQALEALSEAVRLAEPEGFIRSFVEEGAPMAALLYSLREEQRKAGATPYLDTLLAAFSQKSQMQEHRLKQAAGHTTSQPHLDPLSERELEVLQLLVEGASNQEIAQALVIARDTVKRHVSHIFSKLGVQNRIQAERQARELRLLDEIH